MEVTPEQKAQLEQLKREALRKILTGGAIERLARVRMANPMLAEQVELYFLQLFQQGQIKTQVDEEKLKQILGMLTQKKERKFTFKRG